MHTILTPESPRTRPVPTFTDVRPADARRVTTGMRLLLYVLTGLTFGAGTELFVLADHTDVFFSWAAAPPVGAAFVGAGFWSASTVVFWAARQRDWVHARVIVPTIAVVATMLLGATLQHLEQFHGPLGFAWIEVYAVFPALLAALTAMQLFAPGRDRHSGARLPGVLRAVLSVQALVAIGIGIALFASSSLAASLWPWELSELMRQATGTWLIGTGVASAVVALVDDRASAAGNALAQLVLGAGALFAIARFGGDVDLGDPTAWLLVSYLIGLVASGTVGVRLAHRDGLLAPTGVRAAIPVNVR
jgi:hypothetical protein